ncbi:MAG: hypothetical protein N4A35_09265 [Flavobacteriales bacterium]|jgi:hypothetical protein|nr:hypothetical protein [Flavobacteriales bacterium]
MKINYDRPQLEPSKINQKKDFNEIMRLQKAMKPFYQQNWFFISVSLVSIAVLTFVFAPKTTLKSSDSSTIAIKKKDSTHINKTPVPFKEETSCINKPLKNLQIPFKTFLILPQKAQQIHYNGATLTIPKNAFVYSDGTTVRDTVALELSVYNDPVDFLISGIPMEYDSAGMTYTFESGGMLQLKGNTLNNLPIAINKTTPLAIAFNASISSPDFNFYHLDTISKKWNFLMSNTLKQTTTFEQDKTHSFDETSWKLAYKEQNIANQKWERAQKELHKHLTTEPVAPKKLINKEESFTLDIDKYEFPELASFGSVQFAPIKSSKNIQYIYNTEWDDIQLRPHHKAMTYELVLKNKTDVELVVAQPVYTGKDWEKAQHIYGNKYAKYVAILDQKEEKAQRLKEDYEEKKKRFDERDQLKNKAKEVISTVAVALAAPIASFGVFNFDRPIINRPKMPSPPENSIALKAVEQPLFLNTSNDTISFEKIYVIESKRNASFTYYLNKSNYFSYNPQSNISIIGIKEGQQLFLVNKASFKDAISNNSAFQTNEIKNLSLDELKKLILKI